MRFIVVALVVGLIAAFSVATGSNASAAPKDPFIGSWEATDPVDGSHMQISIGGGSGVHHISWREDYWTACEGEPGIGLGVGTADGDVLDTEIIVRCPTLGSMLSVPITFTYDEASDTLSGQDATWHRVGQ